MAKLSDLEKALNERFITAFDYLIDNNHFDNEKALCHLLGLYQTNIKKYREVERKDARPVPMDAVIRLIQLHEDFNGHWFLTGKKEMFLKPEQDSASATGKADNKGDRMPLVITVDKQQKEVIPLVPLAAKAGYLTGYMDPVFISTLPMYSLPAFVNASYRLYEVEGYSMYQELNKSGLRPRDIVVGQYMDDPFDIRDGRVYVIVTDTEILIKRCINRLGSDDKLILKSDNLGGAYPDIILSADEINEVWEFKANLTRHIPPPADTYRIINDLSAKVAILMEDLNKRKKLE